LHHTPFASLSIDVTASHLPTMYELVRSLQAESLVLKAKISRLKSDANDFFMKKNQAVDEVHRLTAVNAKLVERHNTDTEKLKQAADHIAKLEAQLAAAGPTAAASAAEVGPVVLPVGPAVPLTAFAAFAAAHHIEHPCADLPDAVVTDMLDKAAAPKSAKSSKSLKSAKSAKSLKIKSRFTRTSTSREVRNLLR
jgi:hypothetical protein